MSEDLQDEITSINSIYGDATLQPSPDNPTESSSIYTFTHPSQPSVSLRLAFPTDYPDAPPSILGTHSTSHDAAKGEGAALASLLRHVLGQVYVPGAPCIFDVVEESRARIEELQQRQQQLLHGGRDGSSTAGDADARDAAAAASCKDELDGSMSDGADGRGKGRDAEGGGDEGVVPPWVVSEVVTEKKSVFVARAAGVESVEMARGYLGHLLRTDKKVAKATHNITAWRVRGENGVQFQDCDDDGETAAGGRVLHLLELMGVWNAMVVVTRWYGGVQLGPDRFRIINQTARDAMVKGGFSQDGTKDTSGKKKGKKG